MGIGLGHASGGIEIAAAGRVFGILHVLDNIGRIDAVERVIGVSASGRECTRPAGIKIKDAVGQKIATASDDGVVLTPEPPDWGGVGRKMFGVVDEGWIGNNSLLRVRSGILPAARRLRFHSLSPVKERNRCTHAVVFSDYWVRVLRYWQCRHPPFPAIIQPTGLM